MVFLVGWILYYSLLLTGTGLDKLFENFQKGQMIAKFDPAVLKTILDSPDVEFTWMTCPKLDEVFITVQLFRI